MTKTFEDGLLLWKADDDRDGEMVLLNELSDSLILVDADTGGRSGDSTTRL